MRILPPIVLVALAAACGSAAPVPTIEKTTFDASLGVDLAHSTRTADGLYYRDIVAGTGHALVAGETVRVNYVGAFPSGTIFDQTNGPPLGFQLGDPGFIAGFNEGLLGATVGTTRQLIIPPALGYGAQGAGNGAIPPNSILVFKVTVVPAIESTQFDSSLGVDLAHSSQTLDGAWYRDLVVGTGALLSAGQSVQVHYTGSLANGQQFDSNGPSDTPLSFHVGVGEVIPGWDEGLLGAKVGSTRQLIVPSWLGYGSVAHNTIPPNSILVFGVQILSAQ